MIWVSRLRIPFIIQSLIFLILVYIYIVGNNLAAGIQWIFFRYQQSYFGDSIIVFYKDLFYVQAGLLKGRSAVAAGFEFVATIIMILAFFLFLAAYQLKTGTWIRAAAMGVMSGGFLYLLSDVIQYGIFFHGPAGFVIPVGVPVILVTGWWIYHGEFPDTADNILTENETET